MTKELKKSVTFSILPINLEYVLKKAGIKKKEFDGYNKSNFVNDLLTHLRLKDEAKPKAKTKPKAEIAVVEIENLNNEAWALWVAHRKEVKLKPYKTDLKKKELATLGTYDEQLQIVMISMKNEYAGLFPLKANNSAASKDILQDSSDSNWHLKDQGF